MKKLVAIILCLLMLFSLGANASASSSEPQTSSTFDVGINIYQRSYSNGEMNLVPAKSDEDDTMMLVPVSDKAVYVNGKNGAIRDADKDGYPDASGFVDRIVTVSNSSTGSIETHSAYVRALIAVPKDVEKAVKLCFNQAEVSNNSDTNWTIDTASATINGVDCTVYVCTYNRVLAPGDKTPACLFGFYFDENVNYIHSTKQYTLNGEAFKCNGTVTVHYAAQAVSSDAAQNAKEAFIKAETDVWGKNLSNYDSSTGNTEDFSFVDALQNFVYFVFGEPEAISDSSVPQGIITVVE